MEHAYYKTPDPIPFKRRLYNRLFPWRPCDLPEAPYAYQDVVITKTRVSVSFVDRLRILITGKFEVESRTVTENIVGNTRTNSIVRPGHPIPE